MLSELRQYIQLILAEGRKEDVQKQYPDVDVELLATRDPSGNHKYLQWMAKQVAAGTDPDDVADLVKGFHSSLQRLPKKDINQYSVETLRAALESSSGPSKRQERNVAKEGGKVIYEDDDIVAYYMSTPESCVFYGKGTKWCITSAETGGAAWTQYRGDDQRLTQFYFVIRKSPKGDNFDKVAIDFPTYNPDDDDFEGERPETPEPDFYNAEDETVSLQDIRKHLPTFQNVLNVIEKDAHVQPTEWERLKSKHGIDAWKLVSGILKSAKTMPDHELSYLLQRATKNHTKSLLDAIKELPAGDQVRKRLWKMLPSEVQKRNAEMFLEDPDPEVKKIAKVAFLRNVKQRGIRVYEDGVKDRTMAMIQRLAKDEDPDVRAAVGELTNTNMNLQPILDTLLNDEVPEVRAAALTSIKYVTPDLKIPSEIVYKSAYDQSPLVRANLVRSFSYDSRNQLDPSLISLLVNDEDEKVRDEVTNLTNLTPEQFQKLASDSSMMVRGSAAWSPSAKIEDIQRLMNDPSEYVRKKAASAFAQRQRDAADAARRRPRY